MAKAKSESKGKKPAAEKKAAAKSGKSAAPAAGGASMIDTNLAAANAARLLMARANKPAGGSSAPQPESAMFKQLKAGLNKPSTSAISSLLDKSHGPEPVKTHQQFKQVGHNQTFGADVNRSGVPRRTPG